MLEFYGLQKLYMLLVFHALCDFPLQGDFLARAKNHKQPVPGISWKICLAMHALIHAGGVTLVTNSPALGVMEFGFHCLIDYLKSDGVTDFKIDQLLHVGCKVIWAFLWYMLLHSRETSLF